ncbi:carveol dehydrogenase [Mycolicibacterium flavescens]|uniref:mycofactocin-coupled SDR family oxidoreductase n=1 Tax=Mycobacterium neumannii TaxID=2048551 RepID=UPI000B93FD07|nr:mycofactocin-coupled SDR family oxidoreductase [Mycobacterium neumannii]VEG45539.1 carveol dehydrogenase [Mycolicibacterium flavescens]
MSKSLAGKVAFITGAARGQGRAHAVRLAREGADIIGVDICENIASMTYPNASMADLDETERLVEKEGQRMVARKGDVRSYRDMLTAVDAGVEQFGRIDIIIANAGIVRLAGESDDFMQDWQDVIDTNLTGVYHTIRAALPVMRGGKQGGSIVITSSTAGLKGTASLNASGNAYAAAKRGVVALMQNLANYLAPEWIRVNTIHPTGVLSGMTQNDAMNALMAQAAEGGQNAISGMENALPLPILQPEDVAHAVAFLVSEEAKFITGIQWPLDAGFTVR